MKKWRIGILIKELKERCGIVSAGRDILVLQDTTEIGLSKHAHRLVPGSGVGLAGNKTGLGFMLHASLDFLFPDFLMVNRRKKVGWAMH